MYIIIDFTVLSVRRLIIIEGDLPNQVAVSTGSTVHAISRGDPFGK